MENNLLVKQFFFSRNLALLIYHATDLGWSVQMGELWRPPQMAAIYAKEGKGIKDSNHELRIGADLNLWKQSPAGLNVMSSAHADYKPLGDFWKTLSKPDMVCCWGGDFKTIDDIYHFSVFHNGVK